MFQKLPTTSHATIQGILSQNPILCKKSAIAERCIKLCYDGKSKKIKIYGWCFSTSDSVRLHTSGPTSEEIDPKPKQLNFNKVTNVK